MGSIKYGELDISKVYFGTSEVSKIYYGNTLIYEAGGEPTPPIPDDIAQFIEIGNPTGAYENEYVDSYNAIPYTFNSCNNITSLSLPNEHVFQIDGASSLTSLSLPKCGLIEKIANVPNLATLYIGTEYAGTALASNLSLPSTIKIYVPSARANDYKSASGWSSYADNIYGV